MDLTRRAVVAGGTAAVVLGCGGAGAPASPPQATSGEPATLFLPSRSAAGKDHPLVEQPAWLREAGGLYCPSPRSGGSVLLTFSGESTLALPHRITHYRELPALLAEAKRHGTSVLYLVDWYEPRAGTPPDEGVWNKGDYLPRTAMGGADALRAGLDAVRGAGGHTVLYVEPFVVSKESEVGRAHGEAWSIRPADGGREMPYPRDDELCPADPEVVAYFASVAQRVVGTYGADGLFLDSYGNQRGWRCVEATHGHPLGQGQVFDDGCKALVARLREVITAERPDAVLLCEGAELPELYGSVSASLDWGPHALVERWVWDRPGRVFTAGWSLDDLHQVVAFGQKLAFGGDTWLAPPPGRSAVAWIDEVAPPTMRDRKNEKYRRLFAEDVFRVLHQWRNAGLVLGLPVPSLDAVTPRRWDAPELFQSHEALLGAIAACRVVAARLDAVLAGAPELPSAEAHVRQLCTVASVLAPVAAHASPLRCDGGAPHTVAWRFGEDAVTVVNVGGATTTVAIDAPPGLREIGGAALAPNVEVPAHALRVFLRT